jgi:hypothetical protein
LVQTLLNVFETDDKARALLPQEELEEVAEPTARPSPLRRGRLLANRGA